MISKPKKEDGLDANIALLGKLVWKMHPSPDKLYVQIF